MIAIVPEGMIIPGQFRQQRSELGGLQLPQAPLHCCHRACLQGQALYDALQLNSIRSILQVQGDVQLKLMRNLSMGMAITGPASSPPGGRLAMCKPAQHSISTAQ